MVEKKIVNPGDYLASGEEFIAGKNTVAEKDDIYAAAFGEVHTFGRMVQVVNKTKNFVPLSEGMEAHCIVRELTETKAFLSCMPIVKENERSFPSFDAVLPVSSIRQGYVERIRDEIRIGDILKAKITKIERQDNDISISEQGYGVIKAFCSRCRSNMIINDNKITCTKCNRIETRKLPYGQNRPNRQGDSYGNKYSKFR